MGSKGGNAKEEKFMPSILLVSGWKHTDSENESKLPKQIAGKVGVGAKLGGEALT